MKEIKLVDIDKFVIVDDEDYDKLIQYNWRQSGNETGYVIDRQYKIFGKTIHMPISSEIMGTGRSIIYDHKDRNPFNNQKNNLRSCTHSENCANRIKRIDAQTSLYKGVNFHKATKKWQARITKNGKTLQIGVFSTEEGAAKAYNQKAIELFGEFALINVIP